MDPILAGSLITAGGNLLGGLMGQSNQASINAQNVAYQRLYAQNALQWRANDATKAQASTGINRLSLLGVPTSSFSNLTGSSDAGEGVSKAGQNVGRAAAALLAKQSRAELLNEALVQAKIDNINADTVRLQAHASEIARTFAAPGTGPGVPIPPVDPRRVDWDVHLAKPLEEQYVGPNGGLISLPTAEASQAMQNWGSMPGQIAYGAQSIYSNLKNAAADLVPPYVWNGVDQSQYVPF